MKFANLESLQKKIFDYFQTFTNLDEKSNGFGLSVDHTEKLEVASIASTGFYLSSLVIGVNQKFITFDQAFDQAKLTLNTLLNHVDKDHGFFYHFYDIKNGKRYKKNEVSTIDTALCLCGVITVASFFKGDIEILANHILDEVNWAHFIFEKNHKLYLHMAYNPDKDGDYTNGQPGFIYQWDMFAEQLMMYLFVANKNPNEAFKLYQDFKRDVVTDGKHQFIMTPGNTLFVYQFPLAWLNLKDVVDHQNVSWFENAKQATLNHQQCSLDFKDTYKTFSTSFFGFTASDTPKGYRVFKGLPNVDNKLVTDGTVSPCGPLGSFPFTPEISYQAYLDMLNIKGLYGPYGFFDAFNFENKEVWISKRYYGINQGLILLMTDAATQQSVYQAFMSHEQIIKGMEVLQWKKI